MGARIQTASCEVCLLLIGDELTFMSSGLERYAPPAGGYRCTCQDGSFCSKTVVYVIGRKSYVKIASYAARTAFIIAFSFIHPVISIHATFFSISIHEYNAI